MGGVAGALGGMAGGAKGGGASAGHADPSAAMAAYQQGAQVIEDKFPFALSAYEQAYGQGLRQTISKYNDAELKAFPFTDTAKESIQELRSFLGLKPISDTATLATELRSMADQFNTPPFDNLNSGNSLAGIYEGLANKLERAEYLEDPTQRAGLKQDILGEFAAIQSGVNADLNTWYNATSGKVTGIQKTVDSNSPYYGVTGLNQVASLVGPNVGGGSSGGSGGSYEGWDSAMVAPFAQGLLNSGQAVVGGAAGGSGGSLTKEQQIAIQESNNLIDFLESSMPQLQGLQQKFADLYTDEPKKALTGEQIQDKLEDLPEYQFQFNQGQKALERTQAARGVLQSGGALLEAQEFGQNLAQNVYQTHIGNLANLAGINMPVTQQNIGMTQDLGSTYLNAFNNLAQTRQNSIQDIARSREGAYIRSGDALLKTAITNANNQTKASIANSQQAGRAGAAGGKALGSLFGGLF